ncbi:MAG TPA: N-acetylmuramoyl-L-alanine amidase, partial [Rhodobacteraceae bacterium]|nr:N-acetylmuramoyl-L-alanine amidase [Paracoccaceae bacterium]
AGTASEQLAQLHNRSEILTGIDLSGVDDEVTGILLDLTRNETQLQSYSLVSALMVQLKIFGITLNQSPRREESFSVLKSANVPSILFDLGSLSNNMNLINLRDPTWQSSFGEAIAAGILLWRD